MYIRGRQQTKLGDRVIFRDTRGSRPVEEVVSVVLMVVPEISKSVIMKLCQSAHRFSQTCIPSLSVLRGVVGGSDGRRLRLHQQAPPAAFMSQFFLVHILWR